ncbi:hypothetical protein LCGC14_2707820 [marine sediment metagenome]|uniref:Uncharacterized protein n=1 Tax=marine sediment metagenome TaxID=412755 RepID=A0A0F9C5N9_9ZZZZ
MITEIFFILMLLLLLGIFHFMIRNHRVYLLRTKILWMANPGADNFFEFMDIHDKYTYNEMMLSLRSINSFKRELLTLVKSANDSGGAN